jgi:hypothetical protein
VLTQRPGFVNGRFYIILLAATLGVISAGLVERRAAGTAPGAAEPVQAGAGGAFLVGDWIDVTGPFKTSVQSPPANRSTWSRLGSAFGSVARQPIAAVAFCPQELEPAGCWEVCYDEPVELDAAGVEAVDGCPVEMFDELVLQSVL